MQEFECSKCGYMQPLDDNQESETDQICNECGFTTINESKEAINMKQTKPVRKTILNHELVRVIQEDNKLCLYIKMADGRYAVQRPYDCDARGFIGALNLAVDIIAGKVILGTTVQLDERDFDETKQKAIEAKPILLS